MLDNPPIMKTIKNILATAALICCTTNLSAKQYYGSMFGIRSDGTTVNTGSLQKAIDYISTESPGDTLTIWVGRYLSGSVQLKSNVTILLNEGAVMIGLPSAYDYENINGNSALFLAEGQENITITGKGVIEGNSQQVIEALQKQEAKGYISSAETATPSLIAMDGCKNITISGIIMQDYGANAQLYTNCSDITINQVTTFGKASRNNKGIVLKSNQQVNISDCYFDTLGTPVDVSGNSSGIHIIRTKTPDGKEVKL